MSSFVIPDDGRFYIVNFSGGRTSAYMLWRILDANGGQLPSNCAAVFCNTGREMPQTLDFVRDCGQRWNAPIVWLEYWFDETARGVKGQPRQKHRVTDYESASRNGEPFSQLVRARKYLPNVIQRICTMELKVRTVERWARKDMGLRLSNVCNLLGIRADEPKRVRKALFEECRTDYPLYHAGIDLDAVMGFWQDSDFDLYMDKIFGNCDLCFLKGKRQLLDLVRIQPQLAEWWIEIENWNHDFGRTAFNKRFTYSELLAEAQENPTIDFDWTDEDNPIDCFCGD